jgi:hypothetical protein
MWTVGLQRRWYRGVKSSWQFEGLIRRSSRPAFVHRVTFFLADSRHRTRIGSDEQPLKAPKGPGADTVTAEAWIRLRVHLLEAAECFGRAASCKNA